MIQPRTLSFDYSGPPVDHFDVVVNDAATGGTNFHKGCQFNDPPVSGTTYHVDIGARGLGGAPVDTDMIFGVTAVEADGISSHEVDSQTFQFHDVTLPDPTNLTELP